MNEDEEVLDIGGNLEGLGWGLLFFKFVWPVLLFLIAIIVIFFVGTAFLHTIIGAAPAYAPAQ